MTDATPNRHRAAARARWDRMTDEQRHEATLPARKGRGRVLDVAEQVDALGTELLAELRALRTEVAELRSGRIAA